MTHALVLPSSNRVSTMSSGMGLKWISVLSTPATCLPAQPSVSLRWGRSSDSSNLTRAEVGENAAPDGTTRGARDVSLDCESLLGPAIIQHPQSGTYLDAELLLDPPASPGSRLRGRPPDRRSTRWCPAQAAVRSEETHAARLEPVAPLARRPASPQEPLPSLCRSPAPALPRRRRGPRWPSRRCPASPRESRSPSRARFAVPHSTQTLMDRHGRQRQRRTCRVADLEPKMRNGRESPLCAAIVTRAGPKRLLKLRARPLAKRAQMQDVRRALATAAKLRVATRVHMLQRRKQTPLLRTFAFGVKRRSSFWGRRVKAANQSGYEHNTNFIVAYMIIINLKYKKY
eukprot:scaffold1875_cov253-Pinguiococcus_pyrenoidosus.AAC.10